MSAYNHEIADKFTSNDAYRADLVYCEDYDLFYLWQDNFYQAITPREMNKLVRSFLIATYGQKNINMALVHDIVEQIKISILRSVKTPETKYIAFNDGYLNLNDFLLSPIDKEKVVIYRLPYDYAQTEGQAEVFNHYLSTSIVYENTTTTDTELVKLVQEMMGYLLLDSMKGAGAFFLVGDGANGKSVLSDVIYAMIGEEFCSAMNIRELTTDKFATEGLIGKKVNISNEEESKYMQSDTFKALVTGDPVKAERKFGNKFKFRPTTKYLFCSNSLPTFDSINYGLKRRIKIIPFYRRFEGKDADKHLPEKLRGELPQIVGWAIEGAKRFIEQDYTFTVVEASERESEILAQEISSSLMFVAEMCEMTTNEESYTSNIELYDVYKKWCDDNGKKSKSSQAFHKEILKNVKGIESVIKKVNYQTLRAKNLKIKDSFSLEIVKDEDGNEKVKTQQSITIGNPNGLKDFMDAI